jgi:hypothetical protein
MPKAAEVKEEPKQEAKAVAETPLAQCQVCHGQPIDVNKFPNTGDQCARCGLPLKSTRVDGQPGYVFDKDKIEKDGFVTISTPGAVPIVRFNTNPTGPYEETYQVVYEGAFHMGNLDCPFCGSYLCTFNAISGDIKQTCRKGLSEEKHGRGGICKTVTKFIFRNPSFGPTIRPY